MPRTPEEAMRLIKKEFNPDMTPMLSEDDEMEIDPDKFIKTIHTNRRKAQGLQLKYPAPTPEGVVRVPSYKLALIKNYEDLPKSFKRKTLAMFSVGAGEAEVQAKFSISKRTWDSWILDYPEFAEFISVGLTRSQAWWEDQARQYVNQSTAKFNAALWFMNMKNRFGYKDQRDINVKEEKLIGFTLLPALRDDPRLIEDNSNGQN